MLGHRGTPDAQLPPLYLNRELLDEQNNRPEKESTLVTYIQTMLKDLIDRVKSRQTGSLEERFEALAEELDRLDPRDFIPAKQFEFVQLRLAARNFERIENSYWIQQMEEHSKAAARIRSYTKQLEPKADEKTLKVNKKEKIEACIDDEKAIVERIDKWKDGIVEACAQLDDILNSYGGVGSNIITRSFAFIGNAAVRTIVERDYRELSVKLLPGGAWKNVVVTAGGILEGILFDALTRDPARTVAAMASAQAPKKTSKYGGGVKDITKDTWEDEWSLSDMIKVAVDLKYISPDRDKSIDQTLRGYRNYVHPRVEIKFLKPLREAEALMAKGALDAVCDDIK